jgi:hypothetical protein
MRHAHDPDRRAWTGNGEGGGDRLRRSDALERCVSADPAVKSITVSVAASPLTSTMSVAPNFLAIA